MTLSQIVTDDRAMPQVAPPCPPQRIVSLVPSDTFNVVQLGARARLVGRTRYCVEPPDLADIPIVGGTKAVHVDKVMALAPDLVLANQEENAREDITRLQQAGVAVELMFPRTVDAGFRSLAQLAAAIGAEHASQATALLERAELARWALPTAPASACAPRCFVAIWRKPWMTANNDTYIGDVLRVLGFRNVFGDRPSFDPADGHDVRYPIVQWEEVEQARPDVVLLPDEPYPFADRHAAQLGERLGASAVRCISGRDLCWPGAWAFEGLMRLRDVLRHER
ncbi:MAG: helical backbone metal receptor, partial [Polyangiaceae bacterium]|nr:helical backbone metal receptor [Polyangiaceae bacterium]